MARRASQWREYVPQVTRVAEGVREMLAARRRGEAWTAVRAEPRARKIAATVWGQAWCENLERYRDFENRLPRGRTYVRNGSVVHLEIASGRIDARVRGSDLYRVSIAIAEVTEPRWKAIQAACAGDIGSLVELLEGRLSAAVMAVMTAQGTGLFPEPREITMQCSCPDWATMCKHVAAVMYGVGVRLDAAPALLFALRGVDPNGLIGAVASRPIVGKADGDVLSGDLGAIFGIEIVAEDPTPQRAAKTVKTAKAARPAKTRRSDAAPREITRKQLIALGVPATTISGWYARGVLESAGRAGVYRWTALLEARLAARGR